MAAMEQSRSNSLEMLTGLIYNRLIETAVSPVPGTFVCFWKLRLHACALQGTVAQFRSLLTIFDPEVIKTIVPQTKTVLKIRCITHRNVISN